MCLFSLHQTIKKAAWNRHQQCSFCLLRPLPKRLYNDGSSSRCALDAVLFLHLVLQHLLRERCPYSRATFVSPLHCYCCHHDDEIVQHGCINAKTNYTRGDIHVCLRVRCPSCLSVCLCHKHGSLLFPGGWSWLADCYSPLNLTVVIHTWHITITVSHRWFHQPQLTLQKVGAWVGLETPSSLWGRGW